MNTKIKMKSEIWGLLDCHDVGWVIVNVSIIDRTVLLVAGVCLLHLKSSEHGERDERRLGKS